MNVYKPTKKIGTWPQMVVRLTKERENLKLWNQELASECNQLKLDIKELRKEVEDLKRRCCELWKDVMEAQAKNDS